MKKMYAMMIVVLMSAPAGANKWKSEMKVTGSPGIPADVSHESDLGMAMLTEMNPDKRASLRKGNNGKHEGAGEDSSITVLKTKRSEINERQDIVYRVQLGAFSNAVLENTFRNVPELFSSTFRDGLTRYFTGAFENYKDAAKQRMQMMKNGFEDAFVVALQGEEMITPENREVISRIERELSDEERKRGEPGERKEIVKFKVQVGAYKNKIPTSVMDKFRSLGYIDQVRGEDGIMRYLAGEFNEYSSARKYKEELLSLGFEGAFVVGRQNERIIPVQKAMELME